ncbi:hypothetical protein FD772_13460 [Klebsiella pneumoniae]|nr:hypothetical protein [Klebsiella pneumoniae]
MSQPRRISPLIRTFLKNTRSTKLRKLSSAVIYVLLHHYLCKLPGLRLCAVGRGSLVSDWL